MLLFGLCLSSRAATYYLSASGGNDANNGTSSGTPWKTIIHAQTNVVANDTLLFNRGETFYSTGTGQAVWTNTVNGLTLDAYGSGALPILDGAFTNRWIVIWLTTSNGSVNNLYLRNAGTNAGSNTGSIVQTDASGTNSITGCVMDYHTIDDGVARNNGWLMVTNCQIINCADQGFTMHGTDGGGLIVSGCTVSNCLEAFKNSCTGLTLKVLDTVMTDNGTGDVDALDGCVGTFERCWFKGKTTTGSYAFIKACTQPVTMDYCLFDATRITANVANPQITLDSATIMNNCVIYGNGNGNMNVDAGGTLVMTNSIISSWWRAAFITAPGTLTLDHCITNAITTGTQTVNVNKIAGDPLFVAPNSGDFHLQSGSPAIGTGLNLGYTLDLADNPVANPPDLGVYQFLFPKTTVFTNAININGAVTIK